MSLLPPVVPGLIIGKEKSPKIASELQKPIWLIVLIVIAIIVILSLTKER
jgi:hypothetical protein